MTTGGPGVLVLVATPIGNLGDLSPRAVEELARADVVACEDTRRTGRLLAHAGIDAPRLLRVDDHTEAARSTDVVALVAAGKRVALVTDAGMPAVSDPGQRIVAAIVAAGLDVDVVPGPSSVLAALALSGLPTARFCVEGFLPRRGHARAERLAELASERRTCVLLEAPHRLVATVRDLHDACGRDRGVVIARELTKLHQQVWRGTLGEAIAHLDRTSPRGEHVIVLEGAPAPAEPTDDALRRALDDVLERGSSRRDAVAAVAGRFGVPRRRVYTLALEEVDGAGDDG